MCAVRISRLCLYRCRLRCWHNRRTLRHFFRLRESSFLCSVVCFRRSYRSLFFFFQAEDGIRDVAVTGVQTCALPISCAPFRTLGQCIAAIHVSHNLGGNCTFAGLTSAMTGTTKESLGKAIQGCAPHASAKAAARTATKQANADIKDSESESGPSS